MANRQVWVERASPQGPITRIFRSTHSPEWNKANEAGLLFLVPKFDAVGAIRSQIWKRCAGRCESCGRPVTESGSLYKRGHMHEKVFKGKGGGKGEVSLDNSVMLCYNCHINGAHADRKPQWSGERIG